MPGGGFCFTPPRATAPSCTTPGAVAQCRYKELSAPPPPPAVLQGKTRRTQQATQKATGGLPSHAFAVFSVSQRSRRNQQRGCSGNALVGSGSCQLAAVACGEFHVRRPQDSWAPGAWFRATVWLGRLRDRMTCGGRLYWSRWVRDSLAWFCRRFHLQRFLPEFRFRRLQRKPWDSFTGGRVLSILNSGSQMPPDPIHIVYVGVRVAERR